MRVAYCTREGWTDPANGRWFAGGTTHLRATLPARGLAKYHGLETIVVPVFGQDRKTGEIQPVIQHEDGSLEALPGWDTIVFIRWMNGKGAMTEGPLKTGDSIETITRRARAYGQRVVQDLDDWLWGIPTTNLGYWTTHPKMNADENRDHYKGALSSADLITCSTPDLAKRLERFRRPVALLRNMIELDTYTPQPVRDGPAWTVGWTGSTVFRGGDLETLRGVLGPFLRRHDMTFVHGGHSPGCPPAAQSLGLYPDTPCDLRREVPVEDYPSLFRGIDIFVAPLADRPFNYAKSACKVMEASASGIPYVASAVGPYLDYDGGGAVARRPKDWLRHLERLMDPAEREAQRARQLAQVASQDVSVRVGEWLDAYTG